MKPDHHQSVRASLCTFTPVLNLERIWPKASLDRVRVGTTFLTGLGTTLLTAHTFYPFLPEPEVLLGGTVMLGGIATKQWLLTWYFNTWYYRGLSSYISSKQYSNTTITYDVATILASNNSDVTGAFLQSTFGRVITTRLGITKEAITDFLANERRYTPIDALVLSETGATTLIDVIQQLTVHDGDLANMLYKQGSSPEALVGCTAFVMNMHYAGKRAERFWSRDSLSMRGSIGRRLGLGLRGEALPYTSYPVLKDGIALPGETVTVTKLTKILASSKDSNVLLVVPEEHNASHIVGTLTAHLETTTSLNALVGMKVLAVDTHTLTTSTTTPELLEEALITIFETAVAAGNITLVFYDIATTIERLTEKGIPFVTICEEYLGRHGIHIIVTCKPNEVTTLKQNYHSLINRTEEVLVHTPTPNDILSYLESHTLQTEQRYRVLFEYGALTTLAEALFTYSEPSYDMAHRILNRVAEEAKDSKTYIITRKEVESVISTTTGIPVGDITEHERDFLLEAETILSAEVVGQPRAMKALGQALRRSRINLHFDRPQSSFLFLGQTGVGKTETAKALARYHLRSEDALLRIDMSEYATPQSLARLIGTSEREGVLTTELQVTPQRIILLDEFEKAHTTVQHLFLQILDEGIFTTHTGAHINLRHCIIIATSNAGSDLIEKTNRLRKETSSLNTEVIEHIVSRGLLSRELINRFDDVIIFDTLRQQDELAIAHHLVDELAHTLTEKGFILHVQDTVLKQLVKMAHNESFGARPLRHLITSTLDDIIAKRIIRGEVKPGDTILITKDDL